MTRDEMEQLLTDLGEGAETGTYTAGGWDGSKLDEDRARDLLDRSYYAIRSLLNPWRPIEEAPKDGTEVLITGGTYCYDQDEAGDMPFKDVVIATCSGDAEWTRDGYGREFDGEYYHQPTRFMPIPPAPAEGLSKDVPDTASHAQKKNPDD